MTEPELYVASTLKERIEGQLRIMVCKHSWQKYGFGYKCCSCGYYTGLDNELNELIKKELQGET